MAVKPKEIPLLCPCTGHLRQKEQGYKTENFCFCLLKNVLTGPDV